MITANADNLISNAEEAAKALKEGNVNSHTSYPTFGSQKTDITYDLLLESSSHVCARKD